MTHLTAIIGAGHAGSETAIALRQQGYTGRIVLIGDEAHLPYQRPPLSKAFLLASNPQASEIRPQSAYAQAGIELRLDTRALRVDTANHEVHLEGQPPLQFDQLVFATGCSPRHLQLKGLGQHRAANLHYLRHVQDATGLRSQWREGQRLVIVGGGYIGLEVAAAAVQRGLRVTVLESQERVLARVTATEVSHFYTHVHRAAGVDLRLDTQLDGVQLDDAGNVCELVTATGERIAADLVLVGIGVQPNVELAAASGLPIDNGILADEHTGQVMPGVYAVGDCCNRFSSRYQRHVRLESIPNASEHARNLALALTGKPTAPPTTPWFWSDQYDLKLQIVGLSQGYDQVVIRGSIALHSFVAFYLRGDTLIAADCINRVQEFAAIKKLVQASARGIATHLGDEYVSLKELSTTVAA